jgi:2,3-bisphosphoglycerate-independent phosphoglycerate mutase
VIKKIAKNMISKKNKVKPAIKDAKILPMIMIILDGWGLSNPNRGNAISLAKTKNIDYLSAKYPYAKLYAHGKYVGLPPQQVGNSEAGHMNIGAGRTVEQDAVKINRSIKDGTFFKNPAFLGGITHAKKYHSKIHIMGMLSEDMSPHSDLNHLLSLIKLVREQGMGNNLYLHLFTDGRDSPQHEALRLIMELKKRTKNNIKISTIMGRFYAMDRKKAWERTEEAYDAIVLGKGLPAPEASEAIVESYNRNESDEYIRPYTINKKGLIEDNDSVIFFNLRSDRARQLSKMFVQTDFNKRNPGAPITKRSLKNLRFITMTDFGPDLDSILAAFPSADLSGTLPIVLGGMTQLYIAESEKFAHVTYFFNGGYPGHINGEEHFMIPSPSVKSYDQTPGMKSVDLSNKVINNLKKNLYDFTLLNLAASDMVAHTGNLKAAVKCCQILDTCIKKIVDAYLKKNGTIIITADHGNIEEMIKLKTGEVDTEHSINQVPFILINKKLKGLKFKKNGSLSDIAPTILQLLNRKKPGEMTGKSLIS